MARIIAALLVFSFLVTTLNADDWSIDDTGFEVHFSYGSRPIASYSPDSHGRPIFSVLHSLNGERLTRQWPMQPLAENERRDHPHHRGLWFGHGDVNGVDFWADEHRDGRIVQTKSLTRKINKDGVAIETTNDWIAPDGERVCCDRRQFVFKVIGSRVVIDSCFEWIASDGAVVLGDTKEGTFGVRVAGSTKVDRGLGGRIESSSGETDADAWGKSARWVDYSGPPTASSSAVAGMTIFDHPSNLGYPARWHVRTYGLFAINPIGRHHFVGGEASDGHTIEPGDSLRLAYRIVLHDGPLDRSLAEEDADQFAETNGFLAMDDTKD